MASSLNKITLIGNLGRAPELRFTGTGKAVCTMSVATSKRKKNKDTGEFFDDTQWHRVKAFEENAKWAGEHLTKGRTVLIEGELRYSTFTDKTTQVERTIAEIYVSHIEPFGSKTKTAQEDASAEGASKPTGSAPAGGGLTPEHQEWVSGYDQG